MFSFSRMCQAVSSLLMRQSLCMSRQAQLGTLNTGRQLQHTSPLLLDAQGPNLLSRCMISLAQMHKRGPIKRPPRKPSNLEGNAYGRGVVLKVVIKKPKKPNSANRKCVVLKLSNGHEASAYIPGEGHNLQEHSIVLVRGGRLRDVPGVKLRCERGKYDLAHVKK